MKHVALIALLLSACADEVANVEPLGDYTTWLRIDTRGQAPGHGDTVRIIWVNDFGRMPPGVEWPVTGTIVVKEVYKRDADGTPGSLNIIEIMRRTGGKADDQAGWLFTAADNREAARDGDEVVKDFCWRRCHQAAPYTGAWFDYSKF